MGLRGPKKILDEVALHEFLWVRSDSRHRIIINQCHLAQDLAVSHDLISKAVLDMVRQGLLTRTERRFERNIKEYFVTPPEGEVEKRNQRRIPTWG